MDLSISVVGAEPVKHALQSVADVDLEPALDQAAAFILSRIRKRFLKTRAPSGEIWKESQAARNRAAGIGPHAGGGKTLFASGKLFHSIQLFQKSTGVRTLGTDVTNAKGFPYGAFHQLRGEHRVFIGMNQEDMDIVTQFIVKRVAAALEEQAK